VGAHLIGSLIFGAIGFVAFVYGKRMEFYRTLGLGLALMIVPYFISNLIGLYVIGAGLTIAIFLWRD